MSFIPEGFASSETDAKTRYFKPTKNETSKIRIVCENPIAGFVQWTKENKPVRWDRDAQPPTKDWRPDERPRKFLGVVIWNYETESLQIWEITQRTIIDVLDNLSKDEDFGHPGNYDLKITRRGEGLETTYQTQAVKTEFPSVAMKEMESTPIILEALFDGTDPFADPVVVSNPFV
jgi:hypothetical protein